MPHWKPARSAPRRAVSITETQAGRCARALLAAAALASAPAGALAQKPPQPVIVLDRIVAVVNEEAITRNELEERLRRVQLQLRQQGTPQPPREVLEKQLLEHMIIERVQLQHARETGLRVDDAELDRAIARIAQENKLTLPQLRAALEQDGVAFARFREDIRNEIVIARLREREVENRIVVSEGEIDSFVSAQQGQGERSEEYHLSHILVTVPENASPEQIQARRARAEQALAQLRAGADFRQVAAAFSEAPDALQGGVMGWREATRLPTLFLEALKTMRAGEVSALLRSANGFHILRLNERRGAAAAAVVVRQTRARHILVRTNELVPEAEARRRLLALKERLDNQADFAELARLHSEDPSGVKGGELGWLAPGDTVPEFERAMDALAPGEVSAPVRTPFGWHLIQVLERRDADMTRERQRLAARMALRARKADETYQEWVRQLRDRAYVEIRLEEK
jgi:peptidyl-prolyl cis-trans isomerase SurA